MIQHMHLEKKNVAITLPSSVSPQVVNKPDSHGGSLDWTKICEKSSKVITFIDLAGHEKYLKTTVFGMTGHLPDFCMLMVRRTCLYLCILYEVK